MSEVALASDTVIPDSQAEAMDTDKVQAAQHEPLQQPAGPSNQQLPAKRPASSLGAGAGPSGVETNNSNNSFQFAPTLTNSIYTDIQSAAEAAVQPAVSAVIAVDQQVVKAEKHLLGLMQQQESGQVIFKYLKVKPPELQYDCAEAQAEAASAAQAYQQQLLAAAIKGAEAKLAAVKQEQLSIKVTAMLQMKQDSFGSLPDVWASDAAVQRMQQQQQQLFEWELGKAKRNISSTQQQQAQKQAKKAAAAAAAEVEAGPITLQEQVEQLVAKTVPKVLAAQPAANKGSNSGSSGAGTGTKQQQQQQHGGKQQSKQQQQQQDKGKPPAAPAPATKPSYLEATAGPSTTKARSRSPSPSTNRGRSNSRGTGRGRPRSRFYPNKGSGGGSSGAGSHQEKNGAQQRQQRQSAAA